jgi:hypothetical protein
MKILFILLMVFLMSCQRSNLNSQNSNYEIKNIENNSNLVLQKTDLVEEPLLMTINSIEGYHMDSETIVKLIVEDEIIKIQTLSWEENTIKYSELIILEFIEIYNYHAENYLQNFYHFRQSSVYKGDIFYNLVIKTDRILINTFNGSYEYLGKDITDNIINALSGKQNEYTGKYYFSRLESTETMETFLKDNNLQLSQKTISDIENSYILIGIGGNGRLFIRLYEGLRGSILHRGNRFIDIYNGIIDYGGTGDSFRQSFQMNYYFNENMEINIYLKIYNSSSEFPDENYETWINEYIFVYKKQ